MEISQKDIDVASSIIRQTKSLIKQDNELRKIKGEDFNLISIMKMETNENYTHSNIIGELLNPKGTHHMGDVFLKSFLKIIYSDEYTSRKNFTNFIEIESILQNHKPKIKLEHYIGYKDDIKKTGGRIDILINFGNKFITIENKINAGDQPLQLKRYHNYKKGKNDVFYLTKHGHMASEGSLDDLKENDINCISYEHHITIWLQECLRMATDQPILRESIKQYLLTIKKITFQMQDELNQQMIDLLKNDLKSAEKIHHSFLKAKESIKDNFRNIVFEALKPIAVKHNLNIELGHDISNKFSQIWLMQKNIENRALDYCIESFAGDERDHEGGNMYYGIIVRHPDKSIGNELKFVPIPEKATKWWPTFEWIYTSDNQHLNLSNMDTLELLVNEKYLAKQTDIIVKSFDAFIKNSISEFRVINEKYDKC